MNMIIALTFLGILTLTYATSPPRIRECLHFEAKQNFEPHKYFKGNWYLSHIHNAPPTGVCRASKLEIHQDGSVHKKTYGYKEDGGVTKFEQTYCNGTLGSSEKGKVKFLCAHLENSEHKSFEMDGTVLETDYDNFSVYYICFNEGKDNFGENYLVASRHKDEEPTDSRIAETLKKLRFSLDEFVSRKNVVCKDHPDFVV